MYFELPDRLVERKDFGEATEWYKARNDVRTSGIQLLGGLVLVVGLLFTARTLRLNREGHITDRFSVAVGHLGGPSTATRLGGIYALERIMRDSPSDQPAIVEILAAFVRHEARKPRQDPQRPPVHIAAALRVIGHRNTAHDPKNDVRWRINLSETNLSHCSMRASNFDRANFWKTDLRHAYLVDSSFEDALLGGAKLVGAIVGQSDFTGARYDADTVLGAVDLTQRGAILEAAGGAGS